jgi:superfamily II DNA/RNA helicase
LLQEQARDIFRLENGQQLRLHRHQKEAIEAARTDKSYVLTTGAGSGKSLAYIIPIVDISLTAIPQPHRAHPPLVRVRSKLATAASW